MIRRATTAFVLLLAILPAQRAIGAPSNDSIENAITIASVPFTTTMSTEGATADPIFEPFSWCGSSGATIWYRYLVPASGPLAFHTRGSDFDTVLNIYRWMPSGGLQEVDCNDDEYRPGQDRLETSSTAFKARAGDELYVQVGGAPTSSVHDLIGTGESGTLVLTLEPMADGRLTFRPPLNDDSAAAATIQQLPFNDVLHLNSASGEPESEEEAECWPSDSAMNWRAYECRTAWYRYDARSDGHLTGRGHAFYGAPTMSIFRESDGGLQPIAGSEAGDAYTSGEWDVDVSHVLFPVASGDRIWIQLSDLHKDSDAETWFSLREDPGIDFDVSRIRVEAGGEPGDPMRVIADVHMTDRSAFVYEFVACPVGAPSQSCFRFALARDEPWWYETTDTTVERSWYAAGCVGDFDVTARVWYPFSVDPDPTNNSATTRVSIVAPPTGAGAGVCPFL